MSESVIPAVLLRALSEYKFVGRPLWRMAHGKDHVLVELTFHKTLPTLPVYKRRAESRRQPAPSAGEWSRQPTAARQSPPPTTRPTPPARRQPTTPETTPPAPQTLQIDTPATITVQRPPKTAQITPSPIIQLHRLLLQNHHRQRGREQSRRLWTLHPRSTFMSTLRKSTLYMKSSTSRMSPLQGHRKSSKTTKRRRIINVDLPVYLVYNRDNKHWTLIKGPTSKFNDEVRYDYIE